MPPAPPTSWTTRSLLAWMTDAFTKASLDSPRLMAEMLLAHALGVGRLDLYTGADRPASEEERARLRALAARALKHEPVQYLTGEAWFFSLPFKADRRALIPRPSTETIVETVLQDARKRGVGQLDSPANALRIADVCTGSGAIAVALLKNLRAASAIAADISADALALAAENAERHAVADRIQFLRGDLLAPLAGAGPFDYLCANPPYIPDDEWPAVPPNVKGHEPEIALRGGPDGMRLVAPILEGAPALLQPGGALLVEVAASGAERALALAQRVPGLGDARILEDSDGLPRVILARRG